MNYERKLQKFTLLTLLLAFCFGNLQAQCEYGNIIVEAHDCDPNNLFLVDLDFDYANTSDSFNVSGNGMNYGNFAYTDLYLTLGPFEANGTIYEFVVTDLESPDCTGFAILNPPDCNGSTCEITNLSALALECNPDGTFSVEINFDYVNPPSQFFDVIDGNGNYIGYFPLADLPVTLPSFEPGGTPYEYLQVCINDAPDCCMETEFNSLECPGQCDITNFTYEVSPCNDQGYFFITIDFDWEYTGTSFTIVGNGNDYGEFSYNQVPVTLGPFLGDDGTPWEFGIFDVEHPNCGGWIEPGEISCGMVDCEIFDLIVEAHDCTPNGIFYVDLDFEYQGVSDSFTVVGNGSNYGTFAYSDLYITLGPLAADGSVYEFIVNDQEYPDCGSEAGLVSENCQGGDCQIFDLVAEPGDCDDNGIFPLWINFEVQNPANDFFDLYDMDGDLIGSYPLNELPLVIDYGPSNSDINFVTICINDNPDCCASIEFDPPCNGGGGNCELGDASFEYTPCDGNFYEIIIDFDYANTSDSFNLMGNGVDYGNFAYADLPIQVGPVNFQTIVFIVTDLEQADCARESFSVHSCNECEIWDLIVEAHDCDDQGMFLVDLDFNYANTSDSFTVVGNGTNYGTFAYSDLYITLGPLNGNGMTYEFIVSDQAQPDCGAVVGLESENCQNASCEIVGLEVEVGDCNDDGTFPLWINFEVQNPGNGFFDLFDSNGDLIGFYPLNELPLLIDYGPSNSDVEFITVCVNDNPDCCAAIEFETPNCGGGGDCEMGGIVVENTPCDPNGGFALILDFDYANTSNLFELTINGEVYGQYSYNDLPLEVGYFFINQTQTFLIEIVDVEFPDCALEAVYVAECGGSNCDIIGLEVEVGDCNDDNSYPLWINFEVENPGNDFFDLYDSSGDLIGSYPLNELPLLINYGPSNSNVDFITVCVNDNPNCCAAIEFETPNCGGGGDCEMGGIEVDNTPCDPNGGFALIIDFEYANTSALFELTINGEVYGQYSYNDLPLEVGYFFINQTQTFLIEIVDVEFPDCALEAVYVAECGGSNCDIIGLEVEVGDCNDDNSYPLWINFEVENPGNDFFDLYDSSGDLIGFYPLNELPLLINYGPSNSNVDFITVCVNDNPNCCATIEFETPNCGGGGDCEIWDLIVEAYDCDDQGMFLVDLDFNHANTSDSFYVMGNGNNYGTYAYSDLFITFGPLDGDGVTDYNFIVMDQESNNCVAAYNLGTVNCGNNGDCEISNLQAYPLDCNPDGTYNLIVLFDYENVDGDGFDVYSGPTYVGYYPYNNGLPVTISSFPASGNTFDVLTICDSDSEVCCASLEFEAPDCEECQIFDMTAEALPCNDIYEFQVVLDFEHTGGGALGFLVFGNGNNYGTFDYADLPITLGPFAGDGVTVYEFIAVDIVDNDCLGYVELGTITCMTPPPVWPGDANFNNIANNLDLLSLGIAFGSEGPERPDTGIDWLAWEGEDWSQSFADGSNYKHADCNGDGIVDMEDIQAIDLNYNNTHGDVLPFEETPGTPDDPLLYIDLPTADQIEIGEVFTAPIILGEFDLPVNDIYGIAFTIEFDPEMMDEAGVYVEISNSWFGDQANQLININKAFADQGKIEVAISRTDQTNVSGYGQISYFIGIIDDIAGKTELEINITNVRAIDNEEERIALFAPASIIDLTSSVDPQIEQQIDLFPNPASDVFYIKNTGNVAIETITVYNTLGQMMTQKQMPERLEQIDIANWSSGIYFVELLVAGERITKKIKVTNL